MAEKQQSLACRVYVTLSLELRLVGFEFGC